MMETEAQKQLKTALASAKEAQEEAISLLTSMGETIDLADWVTAKEYAKRFGLESTNVLTNWIRRGIIPPENVRVFERFNNIRLIKAVAYKEALVSEV